MTTVVTEARRQLEYHKRQVEVLQRFIADYEAVPVPGPLRKRDRGSKGAHAQLVSTVAELLRQHGSPLARGELAATLAKRGLLPAAADPVRNLGTILWRSGAFENLEGSGYWPRGAPKPWEMGAR